MKLLTKEIEEKFNSHPFGSQDGLGGNAEVLVKYFNPTGAGTWLITEAEKEDDLIPVLICCCRRHPRPRSRRPDSRRPRCRRRDWGLHSLRPDHRRGLPGDPLRRWPDRASRRACRRPGSAPPLRP